MRANQRLWWLFTGKTDPGDALTDEFSSPYGPRGDFAGTEGCVPPAPPLQQVLGRIEMLEWRRFRNPPLSLGFVFGFLPGMIVGAFLMAMVLTPAHGSGPIVAPPAPRVRLRQSPPPTPSWLRHLRPPAGGQGG